MSIFKNFSGEHAPGPPWSRFCYLNCFKINSAGKNYAWKSNEIWCSFPDKKNSEYAPDMKTIERAHVRPYCRQILESESALDPDFSLNLKTKYYVSPLC